ncbi:MAG: type II secretion system major pseudopilin GspG [Verrucomicrobiales bacterium]|nr:type II secretion system major pseudopilin GspG [Verrucomicrobiales bacterium]
MKKLNHLKQRAASAAFTLVELVIVLTIIGILAGSSIYMVVGFIDDAKYQRAENDIGALKTAIMGFARNNYDRPPTEEQGLMALVERPTSEPVPARWRPYLEDQKALIDPWGNPYQYKSPGQRSGKKYDLWSMGENVEDETDDIGNWSAEAPE